MSGISSESLSSYGVEFAKTGTQHKCLLKFIELPAREPNCGAVFRSFVNAIKLYLKHYTQFVIDHLDQITYLDHNISSSLPQQQQQFQQTQTQALTLVQFDAKFKPLVHQFRQLKEYICLFLFNVFTHL